MKISYKLLYVIQGVKSIFDKVTSCSQLISEFLVTPALFAMLHLIGLALFYTPGVLFSIHYIHMFVQLCTFIINIPFSVARHPALFVSIMTTTWSDDASE